MTAYVFCNACGHRNPPQSAFCSACGGVLDRPSHRTTVLPKTDPLLDGVHDDDNAIVEGGEVAPGETLLVIRQGPEIGMRYTLAGNEVSIGRTPDNAIQLDDFTVSRHHAVALRRGDVWVIRDLGSLNGTYINNSRVDEASLAHGDALQIGRFRLVAFVG